MFNFLICKLVSLFAAASDRGVCEKILENVSNSSFLRSFRSIHRHKTSATVNLHYPKWIRKTFSLTEVVRRNRSEDRGRTGLSQSAVHRVCLDTRKGLSIQPVLTDVQQVTNSIARFTEALPEQRGASRITYVASEQTALLPLSPSLFWKKIRAANKGDAKARRRKLGSLGRWESQWSNPAVRLFRSSATSSLLSHP